MEYRNILVTGAGGFIGYQLCHYLAQAGYAVTGIDLRYPADVEQAPFVAERGDFRDEGLMKIRLEGSDAVFHLASAHLSIRQDEREYWDINVHSLPRLLHQSRRAGVRKFIHVSSVGVYGNLADWPADEQAICRPQSIYGETKLAGEAAVRQFCEKTGLPAVILRPAWVYGPTCPRFQKLYRTLKKGKFVFVGSGSNLRHPLYIADMLQALELAMIRDGADGELLIVGGEQALPTRTIVDSICETMKIAKPRFRIPYSLGKMLALTVESTSRLIHIEPPVSRRTLEFFDTNNAFDITKAKRLLGFAPRYSFEEGVRECGLAWGMGHGAWGEAQRAKREEQR